MTGVAPVPTTGGDVLVVDDEPINVAVLEGHLVSLGFAVRCADGATSALAAVADRRPDVILLDVMMPGRSGLSVCAELKSDPRTASIPVILVTALEAREHRLAGLEVGADEFLTKPVDDVELGLRVRSMTARTRLHDRMGDRASVAVNPIAQEGRP